MTGLRVPLVLGFLIGWTLLVPQIAHGAVCTSTGGGTWGGGSDTATWDCGTPTATDDVVIANGTAISLAGSVTVNSLTIQSGGSLTGATGNDLTVTGDWSNNGTFTHGGSDVTLAASSGTQTVNGAATFGKLYTANSGVKDFATSAILIEVAFFHNGGSMQGGTSTFTFRDGSTIGGSNVKRFHNLIIDGTNVTHTADNMRITGDLTVNNGKNLVFSGARTVYFDGTATQIVTLNGTGSVAFYSMIVSSGAAVRLPQAADTQFTAESVTNNGALQQTKSGITGATTFLTIKNGSSGVVYQGMDVDTGSASLDLTASVAGNASACTNPNGGNYRDRCFRLHASAAASSVSVTLYTTTTEDDITNDAFFQYSNGSWVNRADCADVVNGGGVCTASVDLVAGDNYFLIGDAQSAPTPVVLVAFSATRTGDDVLVRWRTATEIDFAGFYVQRSLQEAGPYARISPFIPAQGQAVVGSGYSYLDQSAASGQPLFYRLEAVDVDGSVAYHGPVRVQAPVQFGQPVMIYLPLARR